MPSVPQPSRRKFIAGNWKMNGLLAELQEISRLAEALRAEPTKARVALFLPATLIRSAAELAAGSAIEIGAQDVHAASSGAHTGDLSAHMLKEAGAALTIVGHSERRADHGETNAIVQAKALAAIRAGLEPIVCIGETLEQRQSELTLAVVEAQLHGSLPLELEGRAFSVAYEPVWAIGTGLTPQVWEVETVHQAIRSFLDTRFPVSNAAILYGGSVKPDNAAALMAAQGVDGALVGGSSLKASDFLAIVRAA